MPCHVINAMPSMTRRRWCVLFFATLFPCRIPFLPFVNEANPYDPGQSTTTATTTATTITAAATTVAATITAAAATIAAAIATTATQTLFARCAHRHHHGLRHRTARGCRRRAPAKRRTHPALETRA
jgi:hypothetical protein